MSRSFRARWALALGTAALALALLAAIRLSVRRPDPPAPPAAAENLRLDRTVAENFRLYPPEGRSFPLVALGACRIARPRLGGFRLGVGNVLELDRLEVNLPLDTDAAVTNAEGRVGATNRVVSVGDILHRTFDLAAIRRLVGVTTPVTGLTVGDLRISAVAGTNRVAVLMASSGRLSGSAFALKDCFFLDANLRQVEARRARLVDENGWRVIAEDGRAADLDQVVAALRRALPKPP
jgi:hypothetical protein